MEIAFFAKEINSKWDRSLERLLAYCTCAGAGISYYRELWEHLKMKDDFALPEGKIFDSYEQLSGVDMVISLGGDGTLLGSATFIRDSGIPVAGINFGRLGFLTAARFDEGENSWIKDLFSDNIALAQLPLLHLEGENIPDDIYPYALNEISVQRTVPSMISIDLSINGEELPTYWADGILIATSTGSTAYSLSVGGPLVMPGADVFIIAPIAPHNLNVRPLIVPGNSVIELKVCSREKDPVVTLDNRLFKYENNTLLRISKAGHHINNVVLPGKNFSFFKALKDKLMWGEDKRNYLL